MSGPGRAIGARAAALVLGLALAGLASGCNKKLSLPAVYNLRPEIELTQAPVATTIPYFYSYEVRWTGFDPDGRVDHYLYVLDPPPPPATDTAWVETTDNRKTLLLSSSDPDSLGTADNPGGYHTFAIKAIDNQGLASPVVSRSFFSYTVAPDVRLTQPAPNKLLHPLLPPSVTFRWTGIDPDGVRSRKPVKYKFHLFKDGVDGFSVQDLGPFFTKLRKTYAPTFAGWDSTTSDTSFQYFGLTPGGTYVFAITAFDEAGAYGPAWTFDKNLLYFFVDYPLVYGPKITMFSDFFSYTYDSPGYLNDPRRTLFLEVPIRQPVTIRWSADPGVYAIMAGYRWALDIARLDDETPRQNRTDLAHWSDLSATTTLATFGPFASTDTSHTFFLEALDSNGLKSLGIISFNVVKPNFHAPLLFVDDTSMPVDQMVAGTDSIQGPPGPYWPSAAELDTFLFARGGVRWRYYPNKALSPPGVFAGYAFDTMSTRQLPTPVVPLTTLAKYSHVVWMCDQTPTISSFLPALQYMTRSGQQNNLASYARLGGKVWMMGGGCGYNTMVGVNVRTNDVGGQTVYSYDAGELVPGRMMYDLTHWQSEFADYLSQGATKGPTLKGGWPGAPDYSSLPGALQSKSFATDPIWPVRANSAFYRSDYQVEYITKPNKIVEDLDVNPDSVRLGSVLDTLYVAAGGTPTGMPVMTYYHGSADPPFLFSGFPLWFFRRYQAIQVGDWVLQNLWGMPREPLPRGDGYSIRPALPDAARPAPPPRRTSPAAVSGGGTRSGTGTARRDRAAAPPRTAPP